MRPLNFIRVAFRVCNGCLFWAKINVCCLSFGAITETAIVVLVRDIYSVICEESCDKK